MSGHPLPIPLTEYIAYFDIYGIKELSERQTHLRYLKILDNAYLDVMAEKIAKTDKGANPAADNPKPAK